MPAITRKGDNCTGHDACAPVPLVGGCIENVTIDGKPVGVVGSTYAPHGCPVHPSHADVITSGSPTVFINGKPAARVGDSVSIGGSVAQGSPTVVIDSLNLNKDEIKNSITCQEIEMGLIKDLSDEEEVIFYIPSIARNEANNDTFLENDVKGWRELARMLAKWVESDPYVINDNDVDNGTAPIYTLTLGFDWLSSFSRWESKYNELIEEALNPAGKDQLIKYLKDSEIWKTGGSFDYSSYSPKDWKKYYCNQRAVDEFFPGYADGLLAVLGAHTIRALAKGYVRICDDSSREITVTDLYFYVHDLFQFEGNQFLGFWSKKVLDYKSFITQDDLEQLKYIALSNKSFINFREKYKQGGDFLVLSQKMHVKEFVQQSFKDTELL